MNITSLEIAQATMDMFFCLFCLIIFVSIKANNPKQKSMGMFVRLFLIATVLFFGETLAYIFRGNLGLFNILVTRIANLMVFAMNIAMANTYVRFVRSVFVEYAGGIHRKSGGAQLQESGAGHPAGADRAAEDPERGDAAHPQRRFG